MKMGPEEPFNPKNIQIINHYSYWLKTLSSALSLQMLDGTPPKFSSIFDFASCQISIKARTGFNDTRILDPIFEILNLDL